MSNLTDITVAQTPCVEHPCQSVDMIVDAQQKDLGGFQVGRVLPAKDCQMVGPWIFFDHLSAHEFAPGTGVDVRPHPHIGLATVTYLFEGQLLHRDSLGNEEIIQPGDINWMTAGQGIVHSERTPPEQRAQAHRLHALQLWVALPREHEATAPNFSHYDASQIPQVTVGGADVRVMIGTAFGTTSPVSVYSPTLYCEVRLPKGAQLELPAAQEKAVFVLSGEVTVHDTSVMPEQMAIIKNPATPTIQAQADSLLVIIGGSPVGERLIWWNFVASERDKLEQAKQAWREKRFAPVDGETEYIPLPTMKPKT